MRSLEAREARKWRAQLRGGQGFDSRTCCIELWRASCGHSPWHVRDCRAFARGDARELDTGRHGCNRHWSREARRLRPQERKAGRPQRDRVLRKKSASGFGGERSFVVPTDSSIRQIISFSLDRSNRTDIPCGRENRRLGLLILTWRLRRRRLEVWLTHTEFTFGLILGRTKRRPSKRVTSWKAGGKLSVWTSASSTKWTALKMQCKRLWRRRHLQKKPLPPAKRKKNPPPRVPPKQRENPASRLLQKLLRRSPMAPTAKWDCWCGSIFRLMKNFPSSAGWHGFLRKSRSRAHRRK